MGLAIKPLHYRSSRCQRSGYTPIYLVSARLDEDDLLAAAARRLLTSRYSFRHEVQDK
jgi:hypothetical protein